MLSSRTSNMAEQSVVPSSHDLEYGVNSSSDPELVIDSDRGKPIKIERHRTHYSECSTDSTQEVQLVRRSDSGISVSSIESPDDVVSSSSASTTQPSTRTASVSSIHKRLFLRSISKDFPAGLPITKSTASIAENQVIASIDDEVANVLRNSYSIDNMMISDQEKGVRLVEKRFLNSSGALHLHINRKLCESDSIGESDGDDYVQLTPCDEEVINHFDREFATTPHIKRPPRPSFDMTQFEHPNGVGSSTKINASELISCCDLCSGSTWTLVCLLLYMCLCLSLCALYVLCGELVKMWNTVLFIHTPCVVLLLQRVKYSIFESTEPSVFIRLLSCAWYCITAPFMELLPLLRLSSALFDQVLMISGDPNDVRELVRKQELIAFGDLVWFCVIGVFPQSITQIYFLLIDSDLDFVNVQHFVVQIVRMTTIGSGIVLCTFLVAFYDRYSPSSSRENAEDASNSKPPGEPFEERRNSCENFVFSMGWCCELLSKSIAVAAAIFLVSQPIIIIAATWILHTAVVIISSIVISMVTKDASPYSLQTLVNDLRLGIISTVFVLNYAPLRSRRLDKLSASAVLLAVNFAENTCVFAMIFFLAFKGSLSADILVRVFGVHYVTFALGVFLLMIYYRLRNAKPLS